MINSVKRLGKVYHTSVYITEPVELEGYVNKSKSGRALLHVPVLLPIDIMYDLFKYPLKAKPSRILLIVRVKEIGRR
jgi:hypothetical protein